MNNIKISIISSVYNKEKYLDKLITSLINQTYKNIEIILVNNGSSDNSLEILKRYQKEDERIKVINIEQNRGQSGGLNAALEEVGGDYFTEIDSDDWMENNCIETVVNNISGQCDFYYWGYNECSDVIEKAQNCFITGELKTKDPVKTMLCHLLNINYKEDGMSIIEIGTPWAKLYKTSLLKDIKHNGNFAIFEDYLWNIKAIKKSKTFYLINEHLYDLRREGNSYTNTINPKKAWEVIIAALTIKEELSDYLTDSEILKAYYKFVSERCVASLYGIKSKKNIVNKDQYKLFINTLKQAIKKEHNIKLRVKYILAKYKLFWLLNLLGSNK